MRNHRTITGNVAERCCVIHVNGGHTSRLNPTSAASLRERCSSMQPRVLCSSSAVVNLQQRSSDVLRAGVGSCLVSSGLIRSGGGVAATTLARTPFTRNEPGAGRGDGTWAPWTRVAVPAAGGRVLARPAQPVVRTPWRMPTLALP